MLTNNYMHGIKVILYGRGKRNKTKQQNKNDLHVREVKNNPCMQTVHELSFEIFAIIISR